MLTIWLHLVIHFNLWFMQPDIDIHLAQITSEVIHSLMKCTLHDILTMWADNHCFKTGLGYTFFCIECRLSVNKLKARPADLPFFQKVFSWSIREAHIKINNCNGGKGWKMRDLVSLRWRAFPCIYTSPLNFLFWKISSL